MAKMDDGLTDDDAGEDKMMNGKQPDSAKLKVGGAKAGKMMNSGLKRKPVRSGIAKAPVAKGASKKGF